MTLCTGYVAAGKSGPSSHLIFKHLSVEVGKRQVRAPRTALLRVGLPVPGPSGDFAGAVRRPVNCAWC